MVTLDYFSFNVGTFDEGFFDPRMNMFIYFLSLALIGQIGFPLFSVRSM